MLHFIKIVQNHVVLYSVSCNTLKTTFFFSAICGDPQFWVDVRYAVSEDDTRHLLKTIMDDDDAPSANEAARPWPSALLHANDRERDAEFVDVLNRTEIMVASFQKEGDLTLTLSQLFLDPVRRPDFHVKELRSETIVDLLR